MYNFMGAGFHSKGVSRIAVGAGGGELSAEQAALRDPGGFRAKLEMVPVQVEPPTAANPQGRHVFRLQHPDYPGQYFNFQSGERVQKARDAGIGKYSDIDANIAAREAWDNSEAKKELAALRAREQQRYIDRIDLENRQLGLQGQQIQNQGDQIKGMIADQKADREERKDNRKDDVKFRDVQFAYQKRRDSVIDARYLNEMAQRNALQVYQADVNAWEVRNGGGSRKAQAFSMIGQALQGLMVA